MKFARFTGYEDYMIRTRVLDDPGIREVRGDMFGEWVYTGEKFSYPEKFFSPIQPNQIIGIGANFVKKLDDLPKILPDIPVFFFKPTSSVIGPEEDCDSREG